MGRTGILALQGGFEAHEEVLNRIGRGSRKVRSLRDLASVDSLIIPGGESTVMTKLLLRFGLLDVLGDEIRRGLPVFGTCAGMILLSSGIEGITQKTLGSMDFTVRRNAYGRQIDSFETPLTWEGERFPALFIRAPQASRLGGGVGVLLEHEGAPVLLREGNRLAASFHPELTGFPGIHEFFLGMA